MRVCNRLILQILLFLVPCIVLAQPSASFFRTINNEARQAKALSQYADAERIYIDGIKNQRISLTNRLTLVLNYVDLCFIRGDYATALNLLESYSPQTAEQKSRWGIRKATVYYFLGNFDKAELLYEEASHIPNLDINSKYELMAYQGAMYMDRKKYTGALSYLNDALSLSTSENQRWNVRMEMVIPLAKTGKTEEALQIITQCISWFYANLGSESRSYQISLRKKAEVLMLMNKSEEAFQAYKTYINEEKKYTLKNFVSKPEQWRLDFWKSLKPNISKAFALENHCPDFLFDIALFRREVAMLGDADKKEMYKRLNVNGLQIRKALKEHEVAIDFVRYHRNDTATYGAIIVPSLNMRKPVKFIPLWTEEELHGYKVDNILRLDDALCSNSMTDKDRLYSDTILSRHIWDRLDKELDMYDYEDVYFAPDGLLHLLAIEYLREDNGVCMHRLTSLTKLLNRNKHALTFRNSMLAAGGFDYDQEDIAEEGTDSKANHEAMEYLQTQLTRIDKPFSYLNGARIEIDSISYCSPFKTDTTTIQTEYQLKKAIKDKKYSILHLSTHGYALDVDVPIIPEAYSDSITEDRSLLASGIALTSANVAYKNQTIEDGIISAREFCEMDMSNIDLMVLSACQTGLGRFSDEGPAGLVRGLKKAGAGSLIVSLWSVSDEATTLFMKHLYRAISEQNSPDIHAAFNAARLNFSKETRQVRQFNSKRMKTERFEESYNLPRFCNSFILIDAIK